MSKKLLNLFRIFKIIFLAMLAVPWKKLFLFRFWKRIYLENGGFLARISFQDKHYPLFRKQKKEWLAKGGTITLNNMILADYSSNAGSVKRHYFNQDLLVASFIFENQPERHVDVASRIDGFVGSVASFRKIEVLDVRPLPQSEHKNIKFTQADVMKPMTIGQTDSLSCLHAIEHFGLGRYMDPIDINGHKKGIHNLVQLVKPGGRLYISFPIGKQDEVHFNAHRIFHPKSIFEIKSIAENMKLVRFDYEGDNRDLHLNVSVDSSVGKTNYGCGIYTFEKY
jgi:hypothetical protein